jgi:hypothetical protein
LPKYSPLTVKSIFAVSPPPITAHVTNASPSRAPPILL